MFEGTGLGNPTIFWLLRFILIAILVYCGWGISYGKQNRFNSYSRFACISYALIEGLRWMRGVDYYHYYNDLVTLFGKYPGLYGRGKITTDPDILYDWIVTFFHYSGLPFWVVFMLYSWVLIFAFVRILKFFRNTAIWALPVFFFVTITQSENYIRQYLAAAFFLLGYSYYLEYKIKKMLWLFLCTILIHFSGFIVIVVFGMTVFFNSRPKIKARLNGRLVLGLLIGLFVFVYFFWDLTNLNYFANFLSENISFGNEKGMAYIENADRWFTNNGSISKRLGRSAVTISVLKDTFRFLTYLSMVIFGFFLKKIDRRFEVIYSFSYLAIIIEMIGGDIEIYSRFYNWFLLLIPLLIGGIMSELKFNPLIKKILTMILIIHFSYYGCIITVFGTALTGYAFIWDANVPLF